MLQPHYTATGKIQYANDGNSQILLTCFVPDQSLNSMWYFVFKVGRVDEIVGVSRIWFHMVRKLLCGLAVSTPDLEHGAASSNPARDELLSESYQSSISIKMIDSQLINTINSCLEEPPSIVIYQYDRQSVDQHNQIIAKKTPVSIVINWRDQQSVVGHNQLLLSRTPVVSIVNINWNDRQPADQHNQLLPRRTTVDRIDRHQSINSWSKCKVEWMNTVTINRVWFYELNVQNWQDR